MRVEKIVDLEELSFTSGVIDVSQLDLLVQLVLRLASWLYCMIKGL